MSIGYISASKMSTFDSALLELSSFSKNSNSLVF